MITTKDCFTEDQLSVFAEPQLGSNQDYVNISKFASNRQIQKSRSPVPIFDPNVVPQMFKEEFLKAKKN
jgi:hypothetical protein